MADPKLPGEFQQVFLIPTTHHPLPITYDLFLFESLFYWNPLFNDSISYFRDEVKPLFKNIGTL